jgi:predicted small metal-binding protein
MLSKYHQQNKVWRDIMPLTVYCRDVGFDCDGIVRAETEDDLLQQVAEHAQTAHGLEKVTEEIVTKVKSVIRKE